MQLVIFDMDGTLTDSLALDENCYVLAIEQTLGLTNIVTEWETYTHTSSSFCLEEIVRHARGSPPTRAESTAVQLRMVEIMSEIGRRQGRCCTVEIPGAADCLRSLRERGYAVAIASGDWPVTAHHKMTAARLPFEVLPAAFCDIAHARTDIMQTALSRASAHYGQARFERIVYIGDGAWDVRACRELNWPLIGIGRDAHAQRLASLGVSHVFPDYSRLPGFIAAIDDASVPHPPAG